MKETKMEKTNLIEFPCEFPIKIMGLNKPELITQVIALIAEKSSEFNAERDIVIKNSSKDKYLSITATIMAHSQEQLDSIYLALNAHELVKITL